MQKTAVTPPRLITLMLLSGLSVVSLNMFLPSLSNIAAEFEADYAIVNLSIAGYAAMTAVLQLILGPLSDRFGRRPVILAGVAFFCVASFGCLLAGDIVTFLCFRMMQAAIASGYTVSLAVIRDLSSARKAASLVGYTSMAWAVAPMLAPMVGGLLDEFFGWRASFWAFLFFGLAVFGLCYFDLRESNIAPAETLVKQFRSYPTLFRARRFWGYALCAAFSRGAFYAFLAGVPMVAMAIFDISIATLGFYIGSITAGFILGSFLAGRFSTGKALTTMMIAGCMISCGGLLSGISILWLGIQHEVTFFGACVFVGIGNGVAIPSCSSGAMSVRPELAGSAAGLSGALTVAAGAAISAITGALLTEENAAFGMLNLMLISSTLGLFAAFYVLQVGRHEAKSKRLSTPSL